MSEDNEDSQNKKDSNISIWICAIGSVVFILAMVIAYFAYLQSNFPLFSRNDYATLGDSFGILSSLFSGLAFAGLIVTIFMQNKTMKAQMEELELARKEYKRQGDELAGQKDVMNAQFQAIQLQQFETTLFKLIDNHKSLLASSSILIPSVTTDGQYWNGLKYIKATFSTISNVEGLVMFELSFQGKKAFCKDFYFSVANILAFLSRNEIVNKDREKYIFYLRIIKSCISTEELNLLYLFLYANKEKDFVDKKLAESGIFYGFEFDSFDFYVYSEMLKFYLNDLKKLEGVNSVLDCFLSVGVGKEVIGEDNFFKNKIDDLNRVKFQLSKVMLEAESSFKEKSLCFENYKSEIERLKLHIESSFGEGDKTYNSYLNPDATRTGSEYRLGDCQDAFSDNPKISAEYMNSLIDGQESCKKSISSIEQCTCFLKSIISKIDILTPPES